MEKFLALSNEKQDTIRNAALACFAKHGYEKASINDIAVTAGFSGARDLHYKHLPKSQVSQRLPFFSILEINRHSTNIYLITAQLK